MMTEDARTRAADRNGTSHKTSRDVTLRQGLQAITRSGRPPDLIELKQFLRDHEVTPRELERLIGGAKLAVEQFPDENTPSATPITPGVESKTRLPAAGHLPAPIEAEPIVGRPSSRQSSSSEPIQPPPPAPTRRIEPGTTTDQNLWDDYEDPFALDAPPRTSRAPATSHEPPPNGPDRVTKLVADLLDDYARSGHVERGTVVVLAARRGIDAYQLERALVQLEQAGVEVDDDIVAEAYDGAGDLDGGTTRRQVGSESRDQLGDYLARAGRIPLIGADVEVRLGAAITAGQRADETLADSEHIADADIVHMGRLSRAGRDAHADLVRANLRLVASVAKHVRYTDCGVELSDRIQDGNIGLLRAAEKFDSTLGFKFSTYATWWIRQSIERGIGDRGRLIRLPVHMHEKLQKFKRARRTLEAQLGRDATIAEVAVELGEEPGKVAETVGYLRSVLSLDAPIAEDDATLADLVATEADVEGWADPVGVVLGADFRRLFDDTLWCVLTEREHHVMAGRFGLGDQDQRTLDAIGGELGVTRERVRQIEAKALAKLRAHPDVALLFEYLTDAAPTAPEVVSPKQVRAGLGGQASVDSATGGPSSDKQTLSDLSAILPR